MTNCEFQNYVKQISSTSSSPTILSLDSGICLDDGVNDFQLKMEEYKRLLFTIERDRELYRMLRERLSKIVDRKLNKKQNEEICNVCCIEIDTKNPKSFITCSHCTRTVCRQKSCSEWEAKESKWECQLCHTNKDSLAKTTSWVEKQFSFNNQKSCYRAKSEIYIPLSDPNDSAFQFESISHFGTAAGSTISATQKMKIREIVEEIVAKMIGGSLDNINVTQLSKNQQYLQLFQKYHSELCEHFTILENCLCALIKQDIPYASNENGEFHGLSHIRLRQLIECIVAETLRLPNLSTSGTSTHHVTTDNTDGIGQYFQPKSYQELLATAVLNKIVDTHAKGHVLSESSPNLSIGYGSNHSTIQKQSTTSSEVSSLELRSESSCAETDKLLNEQVKNYNSLSPCGSYSNLFIDHLDTGRTSMLSDYIASHMVPLPDISGAATTTTEIDTDDENDNLSETSTVSHEDTWENNWLFKKKQNKGKMTSANSVGMLVPAPKDDVRAQIGDKTADEISDLSEAGSDNEESSSSSSSSLLYFAKDPTIDPLNDRLLNKHLIGGKNTADVLDELLDQTSLISSSSLPDYEPIYRETLNEHVKGVNDNICEKEITHSKRLFVKKNETVNGELLKQANNSHEIMSNDDSILPPPTVFSDDDRQSIVTDKAHVSTNRTNGNGADCSDDDEETHSPLSSSISGPLSEDKTTLEIAKGPAPALTVETSSVISLSRTLPISKCYTKDKRLLAESEKHQRRSQLIQKYLDILENIETPSYLTENLYLNTAWPSSDDTDFNIGTNIESSIYFFNNIFSSDQLSSCSTPTVIDSSFNESDEIDSSEANHNEEATIKILSNKSTFNTNKNLTNKLIINKNCENNVDKFESTCSIEITTMASANDEHVDDNIFRHFVPGSIAEREYQKWYNAVEMPNNPYSPEALKRRLSTSSERFIDLPNISPTSQILSSNQSDKGELSQRRDYQRYSRDYYINDAKYSSGMKKRSSDNISTSSTAELTSSYGSLSTLKENGNINEDERSIPSPIVKDLFPLSENQFDIYLARPAFIEENPIEVFETIPSSTNNSSLTHSDDSDTIRIYNLNKQEKIVIREKKTAKTLNQNSPTKGSTPNSLKFLQPKRKLIDPSQVLTIDTEKPMIVQMPMEKNVIEEDVVHALPSVKALARTFCSKTKQSEHHRWNRPTQKRSKMPKTSLNKNNVKRKPTKTQVIPQSAATSHGSADDATIASDLSSLETDPSSTQETKNERPLSPVLIPSGFLKNNIAFFENLKNK